MYGPQRIVKHQFSGILTFVALPQNTREDIFFLRVSSGKMRIPQSRDALAEVLLWALSPNFWDRKGFSQLPHQKIIINKDNND